MVAYPEKIWYSLTMLNSSFGIFHSIKLIEFLGVYNEGELCGEQNCIKY